jgi:predicted ATPase
MIRKVSFRNFKAYRSLDVELEPLTVLVGPNASGKTTLLEGLRLVSSVAQHLLGEPRSQIPAEESLQSHGANAPAELEVSGVWGETAGTAHVKMITYPVHGDKGVEEQSALTILGTWGGRSFPVAQRDTTEKDRMGIFLFKPPLTVFKQALGATTILRFEPRKLAEASYSEAETPFLHSDGQGLASVLAHYKLSRDEVFREIEDALRQIVPAVRRIRIERALVHVQPYKVSGAPLQPIWGDRLVLDMKGAKGVTADSAGEGTLMALGLLAVVLSPEQPSLVLLDDIELALHPVAQGKLIEVLRKIQERKPNLQIVATSHSPFILNYLDPKEVRMTFLAENGFARCEKLTAHPEFEKWKDLMTPGEFWSTVGESWLEKVGETSAHE